MRLLESAREVGVRDAGKSAFGGGGAGLADDAGDGLGGLGTHGEPFVGHFKINAVVGTFARRVVGAGLFELSPVAALAAIHSDDFVIRAVLGAFAVESDCYGHDEGSLMRPGAGGGRTLAEEWRLAKKKFRGKCGKVKKIRDSGVRRPIPGCQRGRSAAAGGLRAGWGR